MNCLEGGRRKVTISFPSVASRRSCQTTAEQLSWRQWEKPGSNSDRQRVGAGEPPRRTSRLGSWRQGCRCGRHTGWASPGVLTTKPRESFAQPGVVTSPAQTQGAEPSNFPESRCPTRGGGLFLQKRVSPSPFLPDVHFCSNSVNDHQF